jgi:hypothetical protein
MLRIIGDRFPDRRVVICPVKVQGEGAANEIAAAIADLNRFGAVDVIIAGRGGGSLEDLWAFNEEVVARAIFASHVPVVSAVGHEIDFTIADFVADARAPTPTAAAEMVLPRKRDLVEQMANLQSRLASGMEDKLDHLRESFQGLVSLSDQAASCARTSSKSMNYPSIWCVDFKIACAELKDCLAERAGVWARPVPWLCSTAVIASPTSCRGADRQEFGGVESRRSAACAFAQGKATCRVEEKE